MTTFPVDLRAHLGGCARIEQASFNLLDGRLSQARTAGGHVITAGGGARLWQGMIELHPLRHGAARGLHARLHQLVSHASSFWVGDAFHDGAGFSARLGSVLPDGRVTLTNAPDGKALRAGDYIAFDYAGRRALHQVCEDRGVAQDGFVSAFEVVPPVREGWAPGVAVTAGAAKCRAIIPPGGLKLADSSRLATGGARLEWIQTLRGA